MLPLLAESCGGKDGDLPWLSAPADVLGLSAGCWLTSGLAEVRTSPGEKGVAVGVSWPAKKSFLGMRGVVLGRPILAGRSSLRVAAPSVHILASFM